MNLLNNIKFLLFFFTLNCLTLNNKVLKIVKESLIYTLPNGGSALIPFLKIWIVIPCAIGMLLVVKQLQKRYSLYTIFQGSTILFLLFYIFFIAFLYPLRDSLQIHISDAWPPSLLTLMFENWVFSLFFVVGDMWSTLMISVLFWNIAAFFFSLDEGKRFYPIFSLDIAGICIGLAGLMAGSDIYSLIAFITIVGFLQMVLLFSAKRLCVSREPPPKEAQKKEKAAKTPFALLLGVIVFSYEFSENFLDFMWKRSAALMHPTPEQFSAYMSATVGWIAVFGTLTCVFLAWPLARKLPWKNLALISPILATVSGGAFLFSLFQEASLETIVFLGFLTSGCMQIIKFTFFDNAKELILLQQDEKSRFNAKLFADGFMASCGKSSASLLQQILLVVLINVETSFPLYGGIFVLLTLCAWIYATIRINSFVDKEYATQPVVS